MRKLNKLKHRYTYLGVTIQKDETVEKPRLRKTINIEMIWTLGMRREDRPAKRIRQSKIKEAEECEEEQGKSEW